MSKQKKPILANKFVIGCARALYGKRYFSKKVQLVEDGTLSCIKTPCIIVANHCSFADVGGLAYAMYPNVANFVASQTQLVGKGVFLKIAGVLLKKQFTVDTSLIRDIKYVLSKGRNVVIFPEAKVSVVGTPNIVKPSIAKLIKMLKVPLVTVRFDGSYLHRPRWAKTKRFVPLVATAKVCVGQDEVGKLSADEIYNRMMENLAYDDYAYQLSNNIHIHDAKLVEGLESVLYKCPNCGSEFAMTSTGNTLTCKHCKSAVQMDSLGVLHGGKFAKVTDWYKWQTQCVAQEVEQGTYSFCGKFVAYKMAKNKFKQVGNATITHNGQGLHVQMQDTSLFFKVGAFYTLSFENNAIYLPTEDAVYKFVINTDVGCTTKMNVAVEQQSLILH